MLFSQREGKTKNNMPWTIIVVGVVITCLLGPATSRGQRGGLQEIEELDRQFIQLYEQGKYVEAARVGKRALKIKEKVLGVEHPDTARSLSNLAIAYERQGEYAQAISTLQRALAIQEETLAPNHPDTAATLNNLANAYHQQANYTQALALHKRALAIKEKALGPNHPDTAVSFTNLANAYSRQGEYMQALALHKRALAIQEKILGLNHPDTAGSLNNMAVEQQHLGDYPQALTLQRRALAIQEKALGARHPDTARSLANLADIYSHQGEYAQAISTLQRALAIREKTLGPDHPDTASSLANLADIYSHQGEYAQAISTLQRALAIREKTLGPDHPDTASSLADLADIYSHQGEYIQALALHKQVLAIREKTLGPNHPATTGSLASLADVYEALGDYARVISLYSQVLAIREKTLGPDHPATVESLSALGVAYYRQGDYPQALALQQQVLAIQEKTRGPEHLNTARSLVNLAAVHEIIGDDSQALILEKRALAIMKQTLGMEHPETAKLLNNLATTYYKQGDYAQALAFLQQALPVGEKTLGPYHPDTARFLLNLANTYRRSGDYTQALQFFRRRLAAEDQGITNVFAVTSEAQKFRYAEQSKVVYRAVLSMIHRQFQNDLAVKRFGLELILKRKGIVLDAQTRIQGSLMETLGGEAMESWQRLARHRSHLSQLLLQGLGKRSPTAYRKAEEELRTAITQEEEFLALRSGRVAQELLQRKVTVDLVAECLPADSALIEFIRIHDPEEGSRTFLSTVRYLGFVLTPDGHVTLVDLGEAVQIDVEIGVALAVMEDAGSPGDVIPHSRRVDAEMTQLYRLLFQPLVEAIGAHTRLLISPDGELSRVPFAALRTPEGRYVIEDFTISYVSSGRDLLRDRDSTSTPVDLLLVANPAFDEQAALRSTTLADATVRARDYNGQFASLPGTAEEARRISPLFTGTKQVLEGSAATESAVRTSPTPKLLHFATHGFFLKDAQTPPVDPFIPVERVGLGPVQGTGNGYLNPMVRSGLALAGANHAQTVTEGDDGLLTALEISGLNLHGTDLVVLSACDTGLGDVQVGEGVYGLRRAFMLAGAKNLVMSLWAVNDKLTLTQMEQFYQDYADGQSAVDALRTAQLQSIATLRKSTQAEFGEAFAPVHLWAPFIVQQTGEGRSSGVLFLARPYGWWNVFVPVLAFVGLLALSRIQLNGMVVEATAHTQPGIEPASSSAVPKTPSSRASSARLICQSPNETIPQEITLSQDEDLLGHSPNCTVHLVHPSVAAYHAQLRKHPQGYVLVDLQSDTGTFVNGRRITENLLKDGWLVRLGEVEFVFREAEESSENNRL